MTAHGPVAPTPQALAVLHPLPLTAVTLAPHGLLGGPAGEDAVCGHPEVETALVELYRLTGHRPYLDLARRFVERRGRGLLGPGRFGPRYWQDHAPVREATEVTGHAVRQLYLLAGLVDVAVETHDTGLLEAAERLWASALATKTYVTGGQGSRHRDEAFGDPYELPPDRAHAETCAAIGAGRRPGPARRTAICG